MPGLCLKNAKKFMRWLGDKIMILKTFVEPPLDNNNYLLIDEEVKEAVLIDCSHYDDKIIKTLEETGAKLKYILLTHAHFDHVMGVYEMVMKTGAEVILHPADELLLKDLNSFTFMLGLPAANIPEVSRYVNDGDIIKFAEHEINVIHTPGHTKGGVGYQVDGKLFSGDTLFKESVGRTDLEGGSHAELEHSIRTKFFTLPDDTVVYPGHGPHTTIGHEKKYNKFI